LHFRSLPGADAGGRSIGSGVAAWRQKLGFVFTILLVFVYYFLSSTELSWARK